MRKIKGNGLSVGQLACPAQLHLAQKNDQTLHARWIADDTFSLCSLKRQTNFNIRLKFSHFPSRIHLLVVDRYVGFQIVHHISNKYVSEGDGVGPEEDNGLTREK